MIREAHARDVEEIKDVVEAAFLSADFTDNNEHNLYERLTKSKSFLKDLSLVYEENGKILGHILLTKINIGHHEALALAPLSVLPAYQRQGIGSKLIEAAHSEAKKLGYDAIVVLGHKSYYSKFGYEQADQYEIYPPFEVPVESFMVKALKPNALKHIEGTVSYDESFFM